MKTMKIEKPTRIAKLPLDNRGFPIPWNVQRDIDGNPMFTVNDQVKHVLALTGDLCPLCGEANQQIRWFVGGPMSAFDPNGAYFDLPGHKSCIEYALQVCPYLTAKNYTHRIDVIDPDKIPEDTIALVDFTQIPGRPEVFVMVASAGTLIISHNPMTIYVKPKEPILGYRYWRKGVRLTKKEAQQIIGIKITAR